MISERSRGYVLGAIAAASYGLNPLFALPLYGAGLGVDSVLFYRYVLAVVMLIKFVFPFAKSALISLNTVLSSNDL